MFVALLGGCGVELALATEAQEMRNKRQTNAVFVDMIGLAWSLGSEQCHSPLVRGARQSTERQRAWLLDRRARDREPTKKNWEDEEEVNCSFGMSCNKKKRPKVGEAEKRRELERESGERAM